MPPEIQDLIRTIRAADFDEAAAAAVRLTSEAPRLAQDYDLVRFCAGIPQPVDPELRSDLERQAGLLIAEMEAAEGVVT